MMMRMTISSRAILSLKSGIPHIGLTGLTLTMLRWRRSSGANTTSACLLTAQGDHEIDLEAMKAGAADYLIKGQLDADKLERVIRYAVEDQRAKERLRRDRDLISRIMETSPV